MRQRGAGARDIQLSFDLELPGAPKSSRSPLKPQKSAENKLLPQLDTLLSLKSHQTPNSILSNAPSSFKNLSTAKNLGPGVPNPNTEDGNPRAPQENSAVELAQQNEKVRPGRKRKIVEDNGEASKVNPPKGQHTTFKGSRTRRHPANVDLTSLDTPTNEAGNLDATKPAVEQSLDQPRQSLDTIKMKGHVQGNQEAPKESKTRKRKPIGQTQRPKKKPKLIPPGLQDREVNLTTELKEGLHEQVRDLSTAAETKSSVQESSKHVCVERPKRGKNHLQPSSALEETSVERVKEDVSAQASSHLTAELGAPDRQPKKRGRKPKALLDNGMEPVKDSTQEPLPGAVTQPSGTDGKPKKRGRKPKIVPKDDVELPADKYIRKVVDSENVHDETLLPQEVQPQPGEGLPATKPQAEKKGIISKARNTRKRIVTVPSLEDLPEGTNDDAEDGSKNDPIEAKAVPKPPRKTFSRETLIPPTTVGVEPGKPSSDGAHEIGSHTAKTQVFVPKTKRTPIEKKQEDNQSVKVPKKRGRPKKISPSDGEAKPTDPSPRPQEEIVEETNPPKTDLNQDAAYTEPPVATESAPSNVLPQLGHEPPQAEPKKKRGRPKKQPSTIPAGASTRDSKSIARQTKIKPKKSSTVPKKSRVAKASTKAVPKATKPVRPTSVSDNSNDDEGNASDDLNFELETGGPRTPGSMLNATNESSKHALDVRFQSRRDETVTRTHSDSAQSQPAQHYDTPMITEPQPAIITDYAIPPPHLPEEIAPVPAAPVLQPPTTEQDRGAAQRNKRERATYLETVPASSKEQRPNEAAAKVRKDRGDKMLTAAAETEKDKDQKNKVSSRGLENFVFSKVGRKARARVVAAAGEDLDPELQGLFDQVKGISRGGAASGAGALKFL